MPTYKSPENISDDKLFGLTVALLNRLFSDSKYSEDEKNLFNMFNFLCPHGIENFIDGEIFSRGAIRIAFPKKIQNSPIDPDREFFCHMAAAYLLHCRLNAVLERCDSAKYKLEAMDKFLYDALCYFAWENYPLWKNRRKDFFEPNIFFEKLHEASFRFVSPTTNMQYVWCGKNAFENEHKPFEIEFCARGFEDSAYDDFGDYMKYLMTKERNSIADFGRSTRGFWGNYIKLGRAHDPHSLEDKPLPEIDLILFCIALALDDNVLRKLILLRNKKHPGRPPINSPLPRCNEDDKNFLKGLIRNAKQNRLVAQREEIRAAERQGFSEEKALKNVPRRLLLNANIELLKNGRHPIIDLSNEEVREIRSYFGKNIISLETCRKHYDLGRVSLSGQILEFWSLS